MRQAIIWTNGDPIHWRIHVQCFDRTKDEQINQDISLSQQELTVTLIVPQYFFVYN